MKYLIIGGVAGGATAAARLRRLDEKSEIIVIERGGYISYANCGLPYYLGRVIPERSHLLLQTPESFMQKYHIEVRLKEEATAIDPQRKELRIKKDDGSTYVESYDKLLLSPGAKPIRPAWEGVDLPGIFTLRNIEDTDQIDHYIATEQPKEAVVIGAGFIGLEMIENLSLRGMKVSLVERETQVMPHVDFPIAALLQRTLQKNGVALHLAQSVKSFRKEGKRIVITCESGMELTTDMVILSIGVRPESELAKEAGLAISERGAILVNEFLETSAKDIYAVGDAIAFPHPITGESSSSFLAGPANRQGRIAADNMHLGNTIRYEGAIVTAIIKAFKRVVATTGLSEKALKQRGIKYLTTITHSPSNANYYPGASLLTIKLNYEAETGKLLGAQCSGSSGVDKRIDQLALVIKLGGTVNDLTRIEQAYAPPFSSAKDPVAIAGYVASNALNGTMPAITWDEWRSIKESDPDAILVDVRSHEEHLNGSVPGAINIPQDELRNRLDEIPKNKPIYVHCAIGMRGYLALRILKGAGFNEVYNLTGGFVTYRCVEDGLCVSLTDLDKK